MRRMITLLAALGLVLLMASCGSDEGLYTQEEIDALIEEAVAEALASTTTTESPTTTTTETATTTTTTRIDEDDLVRTMRRLSEIASGGPIDWIDEKTDRQLIGGMVELCDSIDANGFESVVESELWFYILRTYLDDDPRIEDPAPWFDMLGAYDRYWTLSIQNYCPEQAAELAEWSQIRGELAMEILDASG